MERRVYRYETVGSTNTELTELIRQGAAEGTVVLARQQTAGRGRMGRSFQSPAGLGLYGSVLLPEQSGGCSSHPGAGGHGGAPCHPPQLRPVLRHQVAQRSGAVGPEGLRHSGGGSAGTGGQPVGRRGHRHQRLPAAGGFPAGAAGRRRHRCP